MDDIVKRQIVEFLQDSTRNGLFPLVAYSLHGNRLAALTSNIEDLSQAIAVLKTVTREEYNLGRYVRDTVLERIGNENPHLVVHRFMDIVNLERQDKAELGRLIAVFGAPFYKEKAFALVDICGFSPLEYSEQLACLYSLDRVFLQARFRTRAFCDQLHVQPNFGRTSTGDGFYIWSNFLGGHGDVSTFMLLLCLLARARDISLGGKPLRLKASFVIDSAFMLYEPSDSIPDYPQPINAVGAATNGAARLLSKAVPNQLLIGDFSRSGQPGERLTPQALIRQANELFRIEGCGPANLGLSPDERLKVEDKHGEKWYCYNVYGQIPCGEPGASCTVGVQPDSAPGVEKLAFKP